MSDPCIICVAITGSLPTKANNPAVPISIAEQVESTQRPVATWRQAREILGLRMPEGLA